MVEARATVQRGLKCLTNQEALPTCSDPDARRHALRPLNDDVWFERRHIRNVCPDNERGNRGRPMCADLGNDMHRAACCQGMDECAR